MSIWLIVKSAGKSRILLDISFDNDFVINWPALGNMYMAKWLL